MTSNTVVYMHDSKIIRVETNAKFVPPVDAQVLAEVKNEPVLFRVFRIVLVHPATAYYSASPFHLAMKFLENEFKKDILEKNSVTHDTLRGNATEPVDDSLISLVIVFMR